MEMKKIIFKFIEALKKFCKNDLNNSLSSSNNPNVSFTYTNPEGIHNFYKFEDINNYNKEITLDIKEKHKNSDSKNIICQICKKICIINFKNYKFYLSNCGNKHNGEFLLENFMKTQKNINKCSFCSKKLNKSNGKLYYCLLCTKELCDEHKSQHDENHRSKIIDEEKKVNYCEIHYQKYLCYCSKCERNLCKECKKTCIENQHINNIIYFSSLKPDYNVEEKFHNFSEKINILNKEIKSIIAKLKYVKNSFEIIHKINENIVNNFIQKNETYQIYKNIKNIYEFNKKLLKDISLIINENDLIKKIKNIIELYDSFKGTNLSKNQSLRNSFLPNVIGKVSRNNSNFNILSENSISNKIRNISMNNFEIPIKYNLLEHKKIKLKLFGKEFIENNRNNCQIIIDEETKNLTEYIEITKLIKPIKLKINNNIINISSMFYKCNNLYSVDFSKLNNFKVTKMNNLFRGCKILSSISGLSKLNTKEVTDMSCIFKGCKEIKYLPDISEWDTSNTTTFKFLFRKCFNLNKLPDIGKWNVTKARNLSYLFSDCHTIVSLPEISKWNLSNAADISYMFSNCKDLISLPDLSQWNISNVIFMNNLFFGCKSLIRLPDISNWNISNVTDLTSLFDSCEVLKELPDISKWDTTNVTNMSRLFNNCYNLNSLPNINKWNTDKVKNMSYMFYSCQDLKSIPNINKWNTSNVEDMNNMFCSCKLLEKMPNINEWNINKVRNMEYMFNECFLLKFSFNICDWKELNHVNIKKSMFSDINSINKEQISIIEKNKAGAYRNGIKENNNDCLII